MIKRIGNSNVAFKMNVINDNMDSKIFEYKSKQIQNNPYLTLLDERYNVNVTLGQNSISVDCFEKPTSKMGKFAEKILGPTRRVFSTGERRCDSAYLEGTDGYWSRKESALPGAVAHSVFKNYDETKDNEIWCWIGRFATLPGDIVGGLRDYRDRLIHINEKNKNSETSHEFSPKMQRVWHTLKNIRSMHCKEKEARYEAEYQKRVEKGDAGKIEKGVTCTPSDYSLAPGGCF